MPEELSLVEHIDEVEKRLKEMKYDEPIPLRASIIEEEEKKHIGEVSYMLPKTIHELQEIIHIIKNNPGEAIIRLGDGAYKVSKEGKIMLEKLLG